MFLFFYRDIHILEINGSNNKNGTVVLEINGVPDNGFSFNDLKQIGSNKFERNFMEPIKRNLTLVLVTSQATTWELLASNLQGTITILVVRNYFLHL